MVAFKTFTNAKTRIVRTGGTIIAGVTPISALAADTTSFLGGSLGRGTREDIKMPLMQPTAFGWGCEWGKYGRCRSGGFPIRIGECSRKGTMGMTGLCLSFWWQRDTTCACHLTSLNCTYGTRHVTKCYCSAGLTTTRVY